MLTRREDRDMWTVPLLILLFAVAWHVLATFEVRANRHRSNPENPTDLILSYGFGVGFAFMAAVVAWYSAAYPSYTEVQSDDPVFSLMFVVLPVLTGSGASMFLLSRASKPMGQTTDATLLT